jgi:hypothetical protein
VLLLETGGRPALLPLLAAAVLPALIVGGFRGKTRLLRRGRGVLGTSGVEFLEVRLLWPFVGFSRKFTRGKLEKTAAG